jgi:hypothetical protein
VVVDGATSTISPAGGGAGAPGASPEALLSPSSL